MSNSDFANKINNLPIFFIIGRERSGTSLLRSLFDAHKNIAFPMECRLIINLYGKYGSVKKWDMKILNDFYNDLLVQPAFNLFTFNDKKFIANLENFVGDNTYSTICKYVYYCVDSFHEKSEILFIGDKNPTYSLHYNQLNKIFPQAKFIHIIRDYRDNISSMLNVDFEAHIVSSLAIRWKKFNKIIDKNKTNYPSRFFTIRYEDLVVNPSDRMKEICNLLNIDYDDDLLNFYKVRDKIYEVYPDKLINLYQKKLMSPINANNIDNWKNLLTKKQVEIAELICGNYAKKYNYKTTLPLNNVLYIKCLPGIFYGWLFIPVYKIINIFPYSLKIRIYHLLAVVFKQYWKYNSKKV